MRPIDLVVIHCTATPNGRWTSVQDIDSWHEARGFRRSLAARKRHNPDLAAVGYHFVVLTNGAIATGRGLDEVGAHAQGHNQTSLGIALVGTDRYRPAQWRELAAWMASIRRLYPDIRVVGHRDLPEVHKVCPGFDVSAWLARGPDPAHVLES